VTNSRNARRKSNPVFPWRKRFSRTLPSKPTDLYPDLSLRPLRPIFKPEGIFLTWLYPPSYSEFPPPPPPTNSPDFSLNRDDVPANGPSMLFEELWKPNLVLFLDPFFPAIPRAPEYGDLDQCGFLRTIAFLLEEGDLIFHSFSRKRMRSQSAASISQPQPLQGPFSRPRTWIPQSDPLLSQD